MAVRARTTGSIESFSGSDVAPLIRLIGRWERRLRLTHTAIWLPRGAIGGLLAALVLAIVSRVSPWLLPGQTLAVGAALVGLGVIAAIGAVWFWPRSTAHSARFFDQRFDLRERLSTAFELSADADESRDPLRSLQLRDTLHQAGKVRAADHLPLRLARRDIALLAVLVAVYALTFVLPNPQTAVIAQQNALNAARTQQIQTLEQIKQDIQANSALSPDQKAALTQIADNAEQQLTQPNVSQAEAAAALTQAAHAFSNAQAKLSNAQQNAYQQAGQSIAQGGAQAGNQNTSAQAMGAALQQGDLTQAANAAQSLGQQLGQMSPSQAQSMAASLDQAANALQNTDPNAAQALHQAAQALNQGDTKAAQQALNQAAQDLRAQQNKLSQSPVSQAAQQAAQQTTQGEQQIAQAGSQSGQNSQNQPPSASNPSNSNPQNQNQAGQQPNTAPNGQPSNQPQPIQSGQTASGDQNQSGANGQPPQNQQQPNPNSQSQGQQPGQTGQQSQPQTGQSQQPGQSSQGGSQSSPQNSQSGQADQSGQGNQPAQNGQNGQSAQAGQSGGAQTYNGAASSSDSQSGPSAGQSNTAANPGQDQNGAPSAGQGAGGAGANVTSGSGNPNNPNAGTIATNNGHSDGSVVTNEHVYAPSFVGGTGGQSVNLPTGNSGDTQSGQPNGYADPSTGSASVPLQNVAGAAAAQADSALDAEHVPIGLRGVIHDYFSGLQPSSSAQPTAP